MWECTGFMVEQGARELCIKAGADARACLLFLLISTLLLGLLIEIINLTNMRIEHSNEIINII